jgi:uncharacterized protein YqjF (DUF2071 family)
MNPDPPVPVSRPWLLQSWKQVTFLHWAVDPAAVRPLVPAALELDLFDGCAWVGIVPFRSRGLRRPGMAALPWLSTYPEVNVRTYVRGGVWFLSLDLGRMISAVGAQFISGLPHYWAASRMERRGNRLGFESRRIRGSALCQMQVEVGRAISEPSDLLHFLTERYKLYTNFRGRLCQGQVEHPRWELKQARVVYLEESLLSAVGVRRPDGEPVVCFSEGVDATLGPIEPV